MKSTKTIVIQSWECLPKTGDGEKFLLNLSTVASEHVGKGGEPAMTSRHGLVVTVSRNVVDRWRKNGEDPSKAALERARRYVENEVKHGTLTESQEIQFTTYE